MRVGILTRRQAALLRECPGPGVGGDCPLAEPESGRLPCAGENVLLRLPVVGRPRSWIISVAADIDRCPLYQLGG